MKTIYLFAVIISMSITSLAQAQKYYHDNGNLKAEGSFADKKQTGEWKFYYESGALNIEGSFINGNRVGEWKFYYENGQI